MINFFNQLRIFLHEAREDGGLIGKTIEMYNDGTYQGNMPNYEKLLSGRAWEFAKKHPVISGFSMGYGMMYIQGWYKNKYVDRILSKDVPSRTE